MNAQVQPVLQRAPLRVLVVEDNCALRRRLVEAIDGQPDMRCVASVAAVEQVLPTAVRHGVDAIVLDLMLEGANALHLIRRLRAALPATRIVVHSSYASEILAGEARRRGANAYVTKTGAVEALLLEVRAHCYCFPRLA